MSLKNDTEFLMLTKPQTFVEKRFTKNGTEVLTLKNPTYDVEYESVTFNDQEFEIAISKDQDTGAYNLTCWTSPDVYGNIEVNPSILKDFLNKALKMVEEFEKLEHSNEDKPIRFYKKYEKYSFLSNFFPSKFQADGFEWDTVEHYYQAQKFPDCPKIQENIRTSPSPSLAKQSGNMNWKICQQYRTEGIRKDWDEIKDDVMLKALRCKFSQNEILKKELISTFPRPLEEDSPKDMYWGRKGQNRLGQLLEQVRDELISKSQENL